MIFLPLRPNHFSIFDILFIYFSFFNPPFLLLHKVIFSKILYKFIDAALKILIFLYHLVLAVFQLKYSIWSFRILFDLCKVKIKGAEFRKVCKINMYPLWLIQSNFLSMVSKYGGISFFAVSPWLPLTESSAFNEFYWFMPHNFPTSRSIFTMFKNTCFSSMPV